MPKQLISVGPAPFRTPQRIAAPSSSGTTALGYNAEADDWLFFLPAGAAAHDHPYSHTSNWWERLAIDLSVSGPHDISYASATTHDLTLTGYSTFTLSEYLTGFATDLRLLLRQDGTGSRTVAWPSNISWGDDGIPTLQTAAAAVDTIGLLSTDDGATWLGYHAASGAGVSDHGALTGLADDDHPQYATDTDLTTHEATSHGRRVVMRVGITNPPEPTSNVNGDGWVYMEV